jgi:aminopeptidase N
MAIKTKFLRYGQAILEKFEEYLNVNYTLPKMDQIALPDFDAGKTVKI